MNVKKKNCLSINDLFIYFLIKECSVQKTLNLKSTKEQKLCFYVYTYNLIFHNNKLFEEDLIQYENGPYNESLERTKNIIKSKIYNNVMFFL
jgi:uncharacterized phage-associated protein